MSESDFWSTTRYALAPFGKFERVENLLGSGMPDVCYLIRRKPALPAVCGWLEMKYEPEWPARPATPARLTTLTREQVLWQAMWTEAGGRAYTLARIGPSYVLLDPPVLRQVFRGELSRAGLEEAACVVSEGAFPTSRIIKCLTE